jgi:DNA repair protein RadC
MTFTDRFVDVRMEVLKASPVMESTRSVAELLVDYGLHAKTNEEVWVVAIDGSRGVRSVVQVAKGSFHDCDVAIPSVIMPVLLAGTDRFILAHNHPSGELTASYNDRDLTDRISRASDVLGLMFEDHVILTPAGDFYSLAGHKQMRNDTVRASGKK